MKKLILMLFAMTAFSFSQAQSIKIVTCKINNASTHSNETCENTLDGVLPAPSPCNLSDRYTDYMGNPGSCPQPTVVLLSVKKLITPQGNYFVYTILDKDDANRQIVHINKGNK